MDQIITKVEHQEKQKQRYNVYLDGHYSFSVYEDTLLKYRLFKGQIVNQEQIQEILRTDEYERAYRTAIQALTFRLRTEREVVDRLTGKGFDPELAQEVVQRLKAEGYINDHEYAMVLTRQRALSQKKGRLFIRQELTQKGISKQDVQEALDQYDENLEYELALDLAVKRWERSKERSREAKHKIGAFLMRRGFPGHVVNRVIRSLPMSGGADEADEFQID